MSAPAEGTHMVVPQGIDAVTGEALTTLGALGCVTGLYPAGSAVAAVATGGPLTQPTTATRDLITAVRADLQQEVQGVDLLDPSRLYIRHAPRGGTSQNFNLWMHRNIDIPGAWYYVADNGDLKQFWASQAITLESHLQRGVRQGYMLEHRHTTPTGLPGWRTIVHQVNFDTATMTNLMENTTRTILRIGRETPVELVRNPQGERTSNPPGQSGIERPTGFPSA